LSWRHFKRIFERIRRAECEKKSRRGAEVLKRERVGECRKGREERQMGTGVK
jgi:hypothetical protein